MIHKLIQNMVKLFIMTGHKNLVFIILIFIMTSCDLFRWDDGGDYSYKAFVVNSTDSNIRFYNTEYLTGYIIDTVIHPQTKILLKGSREVDKSDDVVKDFLFGNVSIDTVMLYNKDSLLTTWYGPPQSLGDSISHFYNYDSWEVELVDNEYIIEFTIYESDLKGN